MLKYFRVINTIESLVSTTFQWFYGNNNNTYTCAKVSKWVSLQEGYASAYCIIFSTGLIFFLILKDREEIVL